MRRRRPSKAQNIPCMQHDTSGRVIDHGRLPDRPQVHDFGLAYLCNRSYVSDVPDSLFRLPYFYAVTKPSASKWP